MLNLHLVALVGVEDGRDAEGTLALNVPSVVHVNVTVDEIFRLIAVNKFAESVEAAMGVIVTALHPRGGSVGDDDVHATCPANLPVAAANTPRHLLLGVLVDAAIIVGRAAKT